ncbi:MAG: aldo/keto reductase [Syntrophobacteraceae bacterium]|nr:aldo/keto reductase [Syntrophobacteraceae bacterium]
MGVGGRFSADTSRDAEQIRALQQGIDLGMTFIDTAEVYGAGHSEELVGRAVRGRRDKVFLASKVSPEHLSPVDLVTSCEKSLRRMGIDHLNLYQIHWPNPAVPLDETLGAMVRLREQGKIGHLGVSNFSLPELERTQCILGSVPLFSVQAEYNLFDRGAEVEIIPWCTHNRVLFIAYSPLDQGRVVGSEVVRKQLAVLAGRLSCTPSQVALNFLCTRGPVLAIPKALRSDHIKENATTCDISLPASLLEEIDRELRIKVERVPWRQIRPAPDQTGDHAVYTSIEEARANVAGHCPSPQDVATDIVRNDHIKPIRVTRLQGRDGGFRYDLAEGRIRFWAWVLAFDGERDVPVLVRD